MKNIQLITGCMLVFMYTAVAQSDPSEWVQRDSMTDTFFTPTELQQLTDQKLRYAKQMAASTLTHFVTHVSNNRFGYTIFIDGQLYIEQTTIPAKEGTAGFKTKEEAERIAGLVIQKLRLGEFPPTVTLGELKEHGIDVE